MNYTELAKIKHAQYTKVGAYTLTELTEDKEGLSFFSIDRTGVKRKHSFSEAGASIVLAKEDPVVEAPVEVAVVEETIAEEPKKITKKVTKKKG